MYIVITLFIILVILVCIFAYIRISWGKRRSELFSYGIKIDTWLREGYDVSVLKKLHDKLLRDIEKDDPLDKVRYVFSKWARKLRWYLNRITRPISRRIQRFIGRKPSIIITKALLLLAVISEIALTLSAIGLLITKDVSTTVGASIAASGLILLIFSIRCLARHKPRIEETVIILVISFIFVMFSSSYLHVNSFNDIKNGITGPFNTQNSSSPDQ
jgi:hypothetical protein